MKLFPRFTPTVLSLMLAAGQAGAATAIGDHLTFQAFGTLGAAMTDYDSSDYVRDQQVKGATKSPSLLVDSNLGLQLTAKANDWLSGTVQTLTMQRTTDKLSTRIEWAYAKLTPVEDLNIRVGKFGLPNFLVSDSRRIGYANLALRPSNEVYGLDVFNGGFQGADISYRIPIAGGALTPSFAYGKNTMDNPGLRIDAKHTKGLNLLWDGDWYTLRLGQVKADPNVPAALLPPGAKETYTFNGFGFTVDRANVVMQGEYVQRRSSAVSQFIDADAWYVQAGYRMGKMVPYVSYAERKAASSSVIAPQTTAALGLRWDAASSAAVKFQLEHINPKGTAGASFITPVTGGGAIGAVNDPVTRPVTTLSVAVDFVY